jgi:catechol 2,3-dioxygenase-like lactoylglutathione lyase family enzyme
VRYILGIDHAVVGVRDLEHARSGYERLGFRLTPRGHHVGMGTADHCVMFPEDHVELLGLVDPAKPTRDLDRFLEQREGMMALALHSIDADATRSAWQEAGLASDLCDLGLMLEPETELRFKKVTLPLEATGGVPLFACAHLTPEPMRQPEWLEHPNGSVGIASITVAVDEPGALVEPMAQVFGSTNLTETDDTLAVHTGHGVVLFATPDDLDMLHPHLETLALDSHPTLATLSLEVRDLERTAAWLEEHDVPYSRDRRGAIGIAPELTHGVMLEFVAASSSTWGYLPVEQ